MEGEQRFTRQDFLGAANAIRPGATDRLITDWVEIGLLDHPYKPGRGRGGGSHPGTWPESQLKLFRSLWLKKPEATIADLCNFPVYLWLYWGDDYAPLRQVRTAMNSWLARLIRVPTKAADDAAAYILSIVEGGRLPRARRDLLAEALKATPPDLESARGAIVGRTQPKRVTNPLPADRTVDVDPELIMRLLTGRVAAEGQLDTLPDSLFEWARFFNLFAEEQYQYEQPMLGADSRHGRLFPPRQHDHMIKFSCANLLTLLGASLTVKPKDDYIANHLDPTEWREGKCRGLIRRTQMTDAGLAVEFAVVPVVTSAK